MLCIDYTENKIHSNKFEIFSKLENFGHKSLGVSNQFFNIFYAFSVKTTSTDDLKRIK